MCDVSCKLGDSKVSVTKPGSRGCAGGVGDVRSGGEVRGSRRLHAVTQS